MNWAGVVRSGEISTNKDLGEGEADSLASGP